TVRTEGPQFILRVERILLELHRWGRGTDSAVYRISPFLHDPCLTHMFVLKNLLGRQDRTAGNASSIHLSNEVRTLDLDGFRRHNLVKFGKTSRFVESGRRSEPRICDEIVTTHGTKQFMSLFERN